jgi:hypothetical protein
MLENRQLNLLLPINNDRSEAERKKKENQKAITPSSKYSYEAILASLAKKGLLQKKGNN